MKKALVPFIVGILVTVGGLIAATKISGCNCNPICICNGCDCHK